LKRYFLLVLFHAFALFYSCTNSDISDNSNNDTTNALLKDLSKEKWTDAEKIEILNKAYQNVPLLDHDSIKKNILLEISYQYLRLNDSTAFLKTNREARKWSKILKDSSGIAATFWDLAHFYHQRNMEDSAYYYYNNAQRIYDLKGIDLHSARLLLNMAIIQKNVKDYTGSEITTTNAIALLKPLNEYKQLYVAYNNLGIIFNELEEYDKALEYYERANHFLQQTEKKKLFPSLWNNIGVVYHNKEEYGRAIDFYKRGISGIVKKDDPKLYAMILDNLAYSQFRSGDTTGVLEQFNASLEIRKELDIIPGVTVNKLHMAEYFLDQKDTSTTINLAYQAKELAMQSQNTRDLLSSLLLLSKTIEDSALYYSQEYIKINDSLQKEERATRNKFARIRFETDEYISETERLNQRVLIVSFSALGIFVILILLYIIKDQRSRNKLIKQKQYADQEIYNLILAQQKKYEEGREKEKQHISRELHDGILGKLFGVRLNLDSLNDEDTEESKNKRFLYIEELQKISEEIRLVSHKLNEGSIVDVDFTTVLQELVEKQTFAAISPRLILEDSINWNLIENNIKINIYRILQEAIYNIQKHSGATEGFVEFRKMRENILLKIKDNGTGFIHDGSEEGIGLKNMRTRTRSINGTINFKTSGSGTIVELLVPIKTFM
jgi:signal transduction histidine kinase